MRRALPILLGSVLAACGLSSGGVTVRNVQHAPLYSPELVRYVGAGRDVPPRVVSPGGAGEAGRRTETVEAALAGIGWLPLDRVTATPDGSERGNFHIAVAIDAPVWLDADDACAGAVGPDDLGPSDGASHVLLAFCNEARPLGAARAVVAPIASAGAPPLAAAVKAAAVRVFPLRDPDGSGDEAEWPLRF